MNSVHIMKHLAHFEKMYLYDFMTIFSDQSENSYQTEKHNCNLAVPWTGCWLVIEFVEKMGSKGQNVNCKSKVKVNTQ